MCSVKSRMKKVVSGKGELGTRAAPAQAGNNDAEIGSRLDHGKKFIGEDGREYQRLKLQLNKQAADATLRKLAKQDSHRAEADVPTGSEGKSEVVEKLFEDLAADAKAKSKS